MYQPYCPERDSDTDLVRVQGDQMRGNKWSQLQILLTPLKPQTLFKDI